MHPYEMAATLKQRHKEDSIKLRYGSLYTVIDLLVERGLIAPRRRRAPASGRSERSTSSLPPGYDELRDWMRDLLRDPVNEYPQFAAGLCLLPVLPPEEAVALLRERAIHLSGEAARLEAQLGRACAPGGRRCRRRKCRPAWSARNFRRCSWSRPNTRLALIRAELAFVNELVRRITEENWGPVDLWRELQTASARQHETESSDSGGRPRCNARANTKPRRCWNTAGAGPENQTRGARWPSGAHLQATSERSARTARPTDNVGRQQLCASHRSFPCPNRFMFSSSAAALAD